MKKIQDEIQFYPACLFTLHRNIIKGWLPRSFPEKAPIDSMSRSGGNGKNQRQSGEIKFFGTVCVRVTKIKLRE